MLKPELLATPIQDTLERDKTKLNRRQPIGFKAVVCPKCECEHEIEIKLEDVTSDARE